MITDYNKQAQDFLDKAKITFKADLAVPQTAPRWAKDGQHGIKWSIELTRYRAEMRADKDIAGVKNEYKKAIMSVQFFFWDSVANKEAIDRHNETAMHQRKYPAPSAYDVLAGLYSPAESFEDFCANYGYSEDSREAERTYNEVKELNTKLENFLTAEELEALQEIQ